MIFILIASIIINVLLFSMLYFLVKRYFPKRFTLKHKLLDRPWWVIEEEGKIKGLFSPDGYQAPYIVRGSFEPSIDRNGLNKAHLTLYVNYANSLEEMQGIIAGKENAKV